MQLFRSPLFQEAARPVVTSYGGRAYGNRYGRRSVTQRHVMSVTQEARIVAAREIAAEVAEVATQRVAMHYDQAA
jgi:hypothetical protein